MKHAWRVRRSTEERSDALTRWDRAHQLLLEWSAAHATDEAESPAPPQLYDWHTKIWIMSFQVWGN